MPGYTSIIISREPLVILFVTATGTELRIAANKIKQHLFPPEYPWPS